MTKQQFEQTFVMLCGNASRQPADEEGRAQALWLKFKDMEAQTFLDMCCRWMDRSKYMPGRLQLSEIQQDIDRDSYKEETIPVFKPVDKWKRRKELISEGWDAWAKGKAKNIENDRIRMEKLKRH